MMSSKYIEIVAVLAAIGMGGLYPKSGYAEETVPGDQRLIESQGTLSDATSGSEAQSHRSPIRLNTIDYKDTDGGSGKLTIAGIALPGNELYLFLDNEPLAKVVPDDGGKWSIESGMKLADGRHTLRADQYDPTTKMLAARAMVSIERAKPGSEPAESSPPKATTP
jgi:hypothetical protein